MSHYAQLYLYLCRWFKAHKSYGNILMIIRCIGQFEETIDNDVTKGKLSCTAHNKLAYCLENLYYECVEEIGHQILNN